MPHQGAESRTRCDRLVSRTDPDGQSIEYAYDLAGNRTAVTTASGTVSYTYDERERLVSVSDPATGTTTYTYDPADNLVETQFPNGTVETRDYDSRHRLTSLATPLVDAQGQPLATISSYDYTLDAMGNRISVLEADGRRVEYQYDPLYRVTQEQHIEGGEIRTVDYSYDPIGNRLSREDSAAGLTTYQYNENDWLLSETNGDETATFTYDSNGNLLALLGDNDAKLRPGQAFQLSTFNEKNGLLTGLLT